MKFAPLVLALSLPLAAPMQAQNVGGHVVIRSGPVSAAVVFGPRPSNYQPMRPLYGPRVVVVGSPYYGDDYWWHNGYQRVTVWYDPERDCYYDHADARYGFRPVVVYRRGGRIYREAAFDRGYRDQRYGRQSGYGHRGHGDNRGQHERGDSHGNGHDHHDNGHRH